MPHSWFRRACALAALLAASEVAALAEVPDLVGRTVRHRGAWYRIAQRVELPPRYERLMLAYLHAT